MKKTISQESICNQLFEVLRKIRYTSSPTLRSLDKYIRENKSYLNMIEKTEKGKYPSQRAILLAHFLNEFHNNQGSVKEYIIPKNIPLNNNNTLEAIVRRSCFRITKVLRKKERFRLDPGPLIKKNYNLYIIFILEKNSRLGNKFAIRQNVRNIKFIVAIYIDKKNRLFKTLHISNKLLPLFITLVQDQMKEVLIPSLEYKIASLKRMGNILYKKDNEIEIEEVALNKTDFYAGDKIIITSNKGDARGYIGALLKQHDPQILKPTNFDLSYVEHLKIRKKGGKTNFIAIEQLEDGAIKITNESKSNDIELNQLLCKKDFFIGNKIIDPKKIPKNRLMQQIIIRGYLPKAEMKIQAYQNILEELKEKNLIRSIKEKYVYRCTRSPRCWEGAAFTSRRCPVCLKNDRSKKWLKGEVVELNEKVIKSKIKEISTNHGIKYRALRPTFYNKKYALQKLDIPNLDEINIYFNLKGLYKNVIKDFMLCPRPLLSVNFKGELKRTLEFIHQIDAASFIITLFFKPADSFLKFVKNEIAKDPKIAEGKEIAFKESLMELKKLKRNRKLKLKRIGNKFEWLVSNIFNYIFKTSDKWGGPNLPDGIFGIKPYNEKKFVFWDAKCYNHTKLSRYAKKKMNGAINDVQYVLKSLEQEDTYEEGKLSHYIFITSNTSKNDFNKIVDEIKNVIERNRLVRKKGKKRRTKNPYYQRLKEINFCCLNINQLIKIGEFFNIKSNRDELNRNWKKFHGIIEKLLSAENGYVKETSISALIAPLISKKEFLPDKRSHRKS